MVSSVSANTLVMILNLKLANAIGLNLLIVSASLDLGSRMVMLEL